jgi:L-iditol 2-dehydrogenase
MKAAHLYGVHDIRIQDDPIPDLAPDEVLIQVKAVGVCGSDLHWFEEAGIGDAVLEESLVPGHEFAGVVASGDLQGARVALDPAIPCGTCEYCRQGNPNFCQRGRFAGYGPTHGAMREYIAWPRDNLHILPDRMTFADGAMLEPLGTAMHAIDLAHLRIGSDVGVFGCGPIGLLAIQLLRWMGAIRIFATDKLGHRLEAARAWGATEVFLAEDGKEAEKILAATGGRGLDAALEISNRGAAVEAAIQAAKPGAAVVLVGIPDDDRTSFRASTARRKGLTLRMSRRMAHTYPRSIALVENERVDVRGVVTHRFPLEEAGEAFSVAARRDGLKVIVEP